MQVVKKILLVDRDINYLAPLERMILREYGRRVSLSLITDENYLREYLSIPQSIDILAIEESLWKDEYAKQNIGRCFLMTEEKENGGNSRGIYKYSSLREVFTILFSEIDLTIGSKEKNNKKLIAVYSPQGGSGKTTLALGLAKALCALSRRVLYLNTEPIQTFGGYTKITDYAERDFLKALSSGGFTEEILMANVQEGAPEILRPIRYSLTGSGMTEENYIPLLKFLKTEEAYDHIIVDMGSHFSSEMAALLNQADCVFMPFTQGISGAMAMEALMRNLDTGNGDKFRFVCNLYRQDRINELAARNLWHYMRERIPYDPEWELKGIRSEKYQRLATGVV